MISQAHLRGTLAVSQQFVNILWIKSLRKREIMFGGGRAIIPPTAIPEALEERRRVAGEELDVDTDGFADEFDKFRFGAVWRERRGFDEFHEFLFQAAGAPFGLDCEGVDFQGVVTCGAEKKV